MTRRPLIGFRDQGEGQLSNAHAPEHEIGAFGGGGKRRTISYRWRCFAEKIVCLSTSKIARSTPAGSASCRPSRVSVRIYRRSFPKPRAKSAGDCQDNTEAADLSRIPAEGSGGIDAAKREQRNPAVGVDHVSEQKRHHRFAHWHFASVCLKSVNPSRSASHTKRLAG